MNPIARLSGASLLLAPVTLAAADLVQQRVLPAGDSGEGSGPAAETAAALARVGAERGLFEVSSWLFYAGAVLTVPMTLVLWRLAVARSPRWAWPAAVLGAVWAVGQFVQLYAHFGMLRAFSTLQDRQAAADHLASTDADAFSLVLFAHFIVGAAFAVPVGAVALRRARVIPWWSLVTVLTGSALLLVLGSSTAVTLAWGVCLAVGLAPAAAAWTRGDLAEGRRAPVGTATVPVG
jgi:hypothetical protein